MVLDKKLWRLEASGETTGFKQRQWNCILDHFSDFTHEIVIKLRATRAFLQSQNSNIIFATNEQPYHRNIKICLYISMTILSSLLFEVLQHNMAKILELIFCYFGARDERVASKGNNWHFNCKYDLYLKSFRQYCRDKIHNLKEIHLILSLKNFLINSWNLFTNRQNMPFSYNY